MKKLEIVVRPDKLDDVKEILTDAGITGMMVSNIMGFGNQMGHKQQYRGTTYAVNLVSKIKVETIVDALQADVIIEKVVNTIATGRVGDGKIFVFPVEDIIRIRTGKRGKEAL